MSAATPRQSEPAGARWFAIGAVLGLLVSGLLVGGWHRTSGGLSVTVLGAARQASVLMTSNHRRVLIAAGSNGSAFSNAVADALSPVDKELDLILVDPTASADVRDRVRALNARLIWSLPEIGKPPASDTVERSFTVEFDEERVLHLIVANDRSWHAELATTAGTVVITPDLQNGNAHLPAASVLVITHDQGEVDHHVPLLIGVPEILAQPDQQSRVVGPGATLRLDLHEDEIRIDDA